MGHATLYAATKSAMTGIVLSGSIELGGEGVRINGVMPTISGTRNVWGSVCAEHGDEATALEKWGKNIPLGRPVSLDEIGDTVAWLLSARASGITGTMMPIDAGNLAQLVSVDAANIN
jgi:NAD(P)-dependent dehydrogenase (short-subunit alcohol dehydrogenase family)